MSCSLGSTVPQQALPAAFGCCFMACLAQGGLEAHSTEHSSENCITLLYLARRCKKGTMGISDEEFACPGNASLSWFGHLHQETLCGMARRAPAFPVLQGRVGTGLHCLPSLTQLHQPLAVNSGSSQAQTASLCPQPSLGSSVS